MCAPGCPWPSRRPGRPPSPRCWPAPASGRWSHAGGAQSGRSAGPPTAQTWYRETGGEEQGVRKNEGEVRRKERVEDRGEGERGTTYGEKGKGKRKGEEKTRKSC